MRYRTHILILAILFSGVIITQVAPLGAGCTDTRADACCTASCRQEVVPECMDLFPCGIVNVSPGGTPACCAGKGRLAGKAPVMRSHRPDSLPVFIHAVASLMDDLIQRAAPPVSLSLPTKKSVSIFTLTQSFLC